MHRMMHRSHVGDNRVVSADRVAALADYNKWAEFYCPTISGISFILPNVIVTLKK